MKQKKTYRPQSTEFINTPGLLRYLIVAAIGGDRDIALNVIAAGYPNLPIHVAVGIIDRTIKFDTDAEGHAVVEVEEEVEEEPKADIPFYAGRIDLPDDDAVDSLMTEIEWRIAGSHPFGIHADTGIFTDPFDYTRGEGQPPRIEFENARAADLVLLLQLAQMERGTLTILEAGVV